MSSSISFERAAEFYDRTRGGLPRGRRFAQIIGRQCPDAQTVLEIGIGTGLIALPLSEMGFEVLGIDIAHSMLQRARERVGARVAQADAAHLPVASGTCDAVVAVWVLHVVGDRLGMLSEAQRVLRPGGQLVIVCADAERAPNDITDAFGSMLEDLGRTRDLPEVVIDLGERAGLTYTDRLRSDPFDYEESPDGVAAQLERREMSSLWDVDSEKWNRVVQPVIDRMYALPEPARPRSQTLWHPIVVFEKPA
ncbi:MAG TPA: class I SAM-dependent methyltransferase [Acidimicrobiia bacterium]|nr:class I SAM-dependent methyltransferase [Acidimicrobiia bacterium]